jgi:hypothetical protein
VVGYLCCCRVLADRYARSTSAGGPVKTENCSDPQLFQFPLKRLLLAIAACAVVLGVIGWVNREYRNVVRSVQDVYALWQVTDMLTYHVAGHQGAVPKSWKDLEAEYQVVNQGYNSFSLEELQQRVGIDFDTLAVEFKSSPGQQCPRVLFVKRNRPLVEAEADANQRLWNSISSTRDFLARTGP